MLRQATTSYGLGAERGGWPWRSSMAGGHASICRGERWKAGGRMGTRERATRRVGGAGVGGAGMVGAAVLGQRWRCEDSWGEWEQGNKWRRTKPYQVISVPGPHGDTCRAHEQDVADARSPPGWKPAFPINQCGVSWIKSVAVRTVCCSRTAARPLPSPKAGQSVHPS